MNAQQEQLVPYVIAQGDYLLKLAHRYGFDADAVWNDPKNDDLRRERPDPGMLAPGDILFIPAQPPLGLSLQQGTTNRYAAAVPKVDVSLVFRGVDGQPLANEPYEVQGLAGSSNAQGVTDATGCARLEVPVTARSVDIAFPRIDLLFSVHVGGLDPASESSGIRHRLQNLGLLLRDAAADEDGEALANALRVFQAKRGLDVTGLLDAATHAALLDDHSI